MTREQEAQLSYQRNMQHNGNGNGDRSRDHHHHHHHQHQPSPQQYRNPPTLRDRMFSMEPTSFMIPRPNINGMQFVQTRGRQGFYLSMRRKGQVYGLAPVNVMPRRGDVRNLFAIPETNGSNHGEENGRQLVQHAEQQQHRPLSQPVQPPQRIDIKPIDEEAIDSYVPYNPDQRRNANAYRQPQPQRQQEARQRTDEWTRGGSDVSSLSDLTIAERRSIADEMPKIEEPDYPMDDDGPADNNNNESKKAEERRQPDGNDDVVVEKL